jgi:hypothetical protein
VVGRRAGSLCSPPPPVLIRTSGNEERGPQGAMPPTNPSYIGTAGLPTHALRAPVVSRNETFSRIAGHDLSPLGSNRLRLALLTAPAGSHPATRPK